MADATGRILHWAGEEDHALQGEKLRSVLVTCGREAVRSLTCGLCAAEPKEQFSLFIAWCALARALQPWAGAVL